MCSSVALKLIAFLLAGLAPSFAPSAGRISVPVRQLGQIAPIRIEAVGFSQTTLASDVVISFKNEGKRAVRAAVFQVEYLGRRDEQLSSVIGLGSFGPKGSFQWNDRLLREWLQPLTGGADHDQWGGGQSSAEPGRSMTILNVSQEILREPPKSARVTVLAYLQEGSGWEFGPPELQNRRAVPDQLPLTDSEYRRLAECCSCCDRRDIIISGKVDESGAFRVQGVKPHLGNSAERAVKEIAGKWTFLPRRAAGKVVAQDLTLLVLIAGPKEARDLGAIPLDGTARAAQDSAMMPIMISGNSVMTWLYSQGVSR